MLTIHFIILYIFPDKDFAHTYHLAKRAFAGNMLQVWGGNFLQLAFSLAEICKKKGLTLKSEPAS